MTFSFCPKDIIERYFWQEEEIPQRAEQFVGLENGEYVNLYADKDDNSVTIYRPNPNAKEVYKPYDYHQKRILIG